MSLSMQPRHAVLALLLAGTLAVSFWPGQEEGGADVVEAVIRPQAPATSQARPRPPASENSARPGAPAGEVVDEAADGTGGALRFATGEAANLFPAQSFRPPPRPAPPAQVPPPPPPMAPPLPFTYVGVWTENGRETVFLERGGQLITTHAGEALPGGWRLDTVGPEGLAFTYVSLNQPRTLRTGP